MLEFGVDFGSLETFSEGRDEGGGLCEGAGCEDDTDGDEVED